MAELAEARQRAEVAQFEGAAGAARVEGGLPATGVPGQGTKDLTARADRQSVGEQQPEAERVVLNGTRLQEVASIRGIPTPKAMRDREQLRESILADLAALPPDIAASQAALVADGLQGFLVEPDAANITDVLDAAFTFGVSADEMESRLKDERQRMIDFVATLNAMRAQASS